MRINAIQIKIQSQTNSHQDMHLSSSSMAFHKLQIVFPSIVLPNFQNSQLSFLNQLDAATKILSVPQEQDLNSTLVIMRQLMNQQQYKYQKSSLQLNLEQQMMVIQQECSYQQGSTGIMCKKETGYTLDENSNKFSFVDAIWNSKSQKESESPKQQYFYFFD